MAGPEGWGEAGSGEGGGGGGEGTCINSAMVIQYRVPMQVTIIIVFIACIRRVCVGPLREYIVRYFIALRNNTSVRSGRRLVRAICDVRDDLLSYQ